MDDNKKVAFNVNFKVLKDTDLMPYGKYKGKPMVEVPAEYLVWMSDNNKLDKSLRAYVTDNKERIYTAVGRVMPDPWYKLSVQRSKYMPPEEGKGQK
jgi:hypothetical protein